MTYPVKIEFLEYVAGLPVNWSNADDWSEYLSEAPTINRRVESENEGEAGVIVFDNASVTFRYDEGCPVYEAFSNDLSGKQRYLFRISAPKSDKTYVQLFEGMADFSTITWAGDQDTISFEIVDKLSALGVLNTVTSRQPISVKDRVLDQLPSATFIDFIFEGAGNEVWIAAGYPYVYQSFTEKIMFAGEVILLPELLNPLTTNWQFNYRLIIESTLQSHPLYPSLTFNRIKFSPSQTLITKVFRYGNGSDFQNASWDDIGCCSKELYGVDINNIVNGTIVSLNGLEIIRSLYNHAWPDVLIVKKPETLSFPVPSEYAIRMIDENPLGSSPLEAIKLLADSMKCYIYVNRQGKLVIQSKTHLGSSGNSQSLETTKRLSYEKKYFWDKLVDGVSVSVKSWVQNENGEYLEGRASVVKFTGGSGFIKPKNELSKQLLIDDSGKNTQEDLDTFAVTEATAYLEFYGNRRSAYEITLRLDDNTINWELTDHIVVGNDIYFFTGMNYDLAEKTASLTLVETVSHEYDPRQALVVLSEKNSITVSSGGEGFSGTTIITQEKGIVYVG